MSDYVCSDCGYHFGGPIDHSECVHEVQCSGCDWKGTDHAEHVAAAVLAAVADAGYTLMRPVTAEEEARNVW